MRIVSGASTDTGQVREGNEDSYIVDRALELFAVADGMGGHRAGEVASATALDGLRAAVTEGTSVADAVGRANTAVWDLAASDSALAGMGTTLTAAIFDGTTLTIGHVGDSRAYLLRNGTFDQLTVDHSLVAELIRDGRISEEQAAVHPQRSIITRALGVDSSVEVDVYSLVLEGGDRVILCSDGLTSMVRPAGIAEVLRAEPDPTAAANALVDAANAAGGEDNITVVVLDAVGEGKDPLPSSVAAAIRGQSVAAAGTTVVGHDTPADAVEVVDSPPVEVTTETTSIDAATATPAPSSERPESPNAPALPRDTARYREPKARRRAGRSIGRILAFALPIIVIIGVAFGAIAYYARNSYFVAFDHGTVTVFRGQPGGVFFWDPTVVTRTTVQKPDLSENFQQIVAGRKEFTSEADARAFLRRMRADVARRSTTTSTSSTSSTSSTTVPTSASSTPSSTSTP